MEAKSIRDLCHLLRKRDVECIEKYVLIYNMMPSQGIFKYSFDGIKFALHTICGT